MLRPLDYVIAAVIGLFVNHVIFGAPFTIISVVSTFNALIVLGVFVPLIKVIICNYRKVPYHG